MLLRGKHQLDSIIIIITAIIFKPNPWDLKAIWVKGLWEENNWSWCLLCDLKLLCNLCFLFIQLISKDETPFKVGERLLGTREKVNFLGWSYYFLFILLISSSSAYFLVLICLHLYSSPLVFQNAISSSMSHLFTFQKYCHYSVIYSHYILPFLNPLKYLYEYCFRGAVGTHYCKWRWQ